LLNATWLVALVAAVMLIGTFWPQAGLFKLFYARLLKPAGLLKPKVVEDDPAPHLFAQGLGGVFLVLSTLALWGGLAVVGWKIAATSAAGQAHINVGGPLPGRILSDFVHPDGATVSLAGNRMRVVEPEFAFRLGADLPARAAPYTAAEVLAAVATLHPAFEVPNSRFAEFTRAGEAQLLADDACCGEFVFGAAAPAGWQRLDLAAHRVRARVTDAAGRERLAREGEGRAALGDPRTALQWLANELSARGLALRAGQTVSTGTCMVPLDVQAGDEVHADYGELGRIHIRLG
jgi:2-keto-4-pentenoate hydratase